MNKFKTNILALVRKVGIFYRVFFSFAILISISAGFLTFFVYLKSSEQMNNNLEKQLQLLVQNVSYKIEETMHQYENLAVSFYDDADLMDFIYATENGIKDGTDTKETDENIKEIEKQLYKIKMGNRYLKSVQFISDNYQYVMRDESGFPRGAVIKEIEYFYKSEFYSKTKNNRGYPVWFEGKEQTELFFKNRQNIYGIADIITMTVSVYHPRTREFLGILIFTIDLKSFENSLLGLDYERNGNIYIVGSDNVLFGVNPNISAPAFPKNINEYKKLVESGKHIVRGKLNNRRLIFAIHQVPFSKLTVTYIADLDTLEAPLIKIRDLCLKIWGLTVLISGMIAYFITISISIPIKGLIENFKTLETGEWSSRYKNTGKDEITTLGNKYNQMAERMEELVGEVYLSEIKRHKLQINLKNSQLEALLMQINPHFLYNTLDIIRWEAMYEAKGESTVTEMIEKFSQLCRMMVQTGTETIPLKEALAHAITYIDVINCRHKEKIELIINSDLETDKVFVPRYVIQPIMENAVVHAFGDRIKDCKISIATFVKTDILYIEIIDNGKGMSDQELEKLQATLLQTENTEKSIGLRNVHQRIVLYYGEEYGVFVTAMQEGGTKITIKLPYKNHAEKME